MFGAIAGGIASFFFSSRRRHTRWTGDWSSDVCSSDLRLGELLLGRATKVAAVLLAAFVVERLARWMVGRVVRGLQRQGVQQRLQSIRARTPRALLATTDPLPSLRHAQRADAIGAVLRNLSSVVIW